MPIGPSTAQTPYLISLEPNVTFTSILSAGDIVGTHPDGSPRPMVGVPDGIGAFDNGDGTMTVLFNHELGAATGAMREHGSTGAFVDKIVVDKTTLQVLSAEDLGKTVFQDNDGDGVYVNATTAFERLCSADLAPTSAFYNARTNLGTTERIYMAGEETGPPFTPDNGRGWAFVVTGADAGKIFELPAMGNISFENLVASPATGNKTVVMEMDDTGNGSTTGGQVYMYVGTKQAAGNTIEKAGLTNGSLYGVKVTGMLDETNGTVLPGDAATFTMQLMPNAKTETGVQLQTDSEAAGATEFLRPEDGAWDPSHPNWFYFNTTASFAGNSRLWRLEFNDINNPEAGGTIRMMLNGTEGQKMLDNITVSADGRVTLVEDVGNNAFLGRVLQYDPTTDTLVPIGIHDAARFGTPPTAPFTQDEEASGVLDVTSILGGPDRKAYLLDTQAHYAIAGELVEGGQLQVMYVDTPRSGGSNNDVIRGSGFADNLSGGGGDDTITTGGGDDLIDGGSGNDVMAGGAGNDSYFVDSGMDAVTEVAGGGIDTVYSTDHLVLAANVENLVLQGGKDLQGYGNALGNAIYGNAGNNILDGAGGGDSTYGGAGNDVYYVDDAGDVVIENVGEGTDVVFATTHFVLPANVEALVLQGSADLQGYGNNLANLVYGNSGANLLDGGGGTDIMVGSAGNDAFVFHPGEGNGDTIVDFDGQGAAAGDVLLFAGFGPGATFTNLNPNQWQVNYNGGSSHDVITFMNGATVDASDFAFI